ncbi:hypothetical protein [Derxia lacustris]|uniref:hypothetical protein n=1 Tax=Derxia lacustris TaxID=764842 RepID=UPI000A174B25|nr:hypothetical protein [Derxia lacustris]
MPIVPSVPDSPVAVSADPTPSASPADPPASAPAARPGADGLLEICFHRLAAPLAVGLLLGWLLARPWARGALGGLLLARGEFASDPEALWRLAGSGVASFVAAALLLAGVVRLVVADLMADVARPELGEDCPARALPLALSSVFVALPAWTATVAGFAAQAPAQTGLARTLAVLAALVLFALLPLLWWRGLPRLERRLAMRRRWRGLRLPPARWRPSLLMAGALTLALALAGLPVAAARAIGTPAILLLWATVALALLGGLTLLWRRAQRRWLGEVRGTMLAAVLLLAWAGGFDPLAEPEADEALPLAAAPAPLPGGLPQRDFAHMRLDVGDIHISAHGGGFGAALATGLTLAEADDLSCGRLAPRLRTLSAVSGGAVGAGVYLVLADAFARLDLRAACRPGSADRPLAAAVADVLRQDHLAPVLAHLPLDLLLRRSTRGQALLDSLQLSVVRRLDRLAEAAPVDLPGDWQPGAAPVAGTPAPTAPQPAARRRGRPAEAAAAAAAAAASAAPAAAPAGLDPDASTLGDLLLHPDRVDDALHRRWQAATERLRDQRLAQAARVAGFDRAGLAVPLAGAGRAIAPALDFSIQLVDAGGGALWLGNGGRARSASAVDGQPGADLAQPADLTLGRALLDAVRFRPWLPAGRLALGGRAVDVVEGGSADPGGHAGLAAALAPGARGIWLDIAAPASDRVHAPGDSHSASARDRFALPAVAPETAARGAIVDRLAGELLRARNPALVALPLRFGDTVAPGCQPATGAAALALVGMAVPAVSRCADR